MRLGIAGAGMIVRGLFTFIHEVEGVELEAIASTEKSIDKVRKMAKENHVKKAYLNYDELLNDEDIDVMYIATPNHGGADNFLDLLIKLNSSFVCTH